MFPFHPEVPGHIINNYIPLHRDQVLCICTTFQALSMKDVAARTKFKANFKTKLDCLKDSPCCIKACIFDKARFMQTTCRMTYIGEPTSEIYLIHEHNASSSYHHSRGVNGELMYRRRDRMQQRGNIDLDPRGRTAKVTDVRWLDDRRTMRDLWTGLGWPWLYWFSGLRVCVRKDSLPGTYPGR